MANDDEAPVKTVSVYNSLTNVHARVSEETAGNLGAHWKPSSAATRKARDEAAGKALKASQATAASAQ